MGSTIPAPCLAVGETVIDRDERAVKVQVLRCEGRRHITVAADLREQVAELAMLADHDRERVQVERLFELP